ncbi:hypothetical protein H5407_23415 [Mitsuaria sp. WAJ17]|uniref:hypothetical protein n=1 Tax=Mitsuaria sp. WAJ17 TaxID=2761452 RepID=UPI001600292D|nr:hypothetical protein [Mitsuaria sp. WAJ17]MBB2488188.1 hypothetical protein [Mitsuaria sp. WAJ17]
MREMMNRSPLGGVLFIALLCVACTKQWMLEIVRWDSETGPVFCFANGNQCGDRGLQIHFITVSQVDAAGDQLRVMWQLQNIDDAKGQSTLTKLAYGVVPDGWVQLIGAKDLQANKYYSVNDSYYFTRDVAFGYKVFSRKEFFDLNSRGK